MKNYRSIQWAKILNPLFVFLYGLTCHYLMDLAQYGGIRRRVPVIVFLSIMLISWLIYHFIKIKNQPASGIIYPDPTVILHKIKFSHYWFITAIISLILITGYTGYNIYQSAIPYNGKLSWYVADYFNQAEVDFEKNNIHENGLHGLIEALQTEVDLPEELYLSNSFTLTYEPGGEITNLSGFLYGKNESQETESFLISYNQAKKSTINIQLNGYVDATFDQNKAFEPFIDGLVIVNLTTYDDLARSGNITIDYEGFQEISASFAPAYYYDAEDLVKFGSIDGLDYVGYSFKVTIPDLEALFIYYDETVINQQYTKREQKAAQDADPNYFDAAEIAEESFLNDTTGYQLVILDAALGSRFYGLRKTVDGGQTWTMHSPDPFLGEIGNAAGLTFIDEQLGFAVLGKSGGIYANLFRTENGGESFTQVEVIPHTVQQDGNEYQPFDFPSVPYEMNGELYLEVGQGADGDYAKGVHALYKSKDDGKTFQFEELLD